MAGIPQEITNSDDIIDSRDVIARIEHLETEKETALEPGGSGCWSDGDEAELVALKALADEASSYASDWEHGEALIRDSYFKTYAMELADDIGALKMDNVSWPYTCIDWDQAARELQMDYTSVEFDGVTYWTR